MPLYFAYGANLDTDAMARRCPRSVPLGRAKLAAHRLFIMSTGYASVRPEPGASVHGLLWRLDPADVAPLDAFEEVGRGLYRKAMRPVIRSPGIVQALVYLGTVGEEGRPKPGYMEAVVAAGRCLGLPDRYLRSLEALSPQGGSRPSCPIRRPLSDLPD